MDNGFLAYVAGILAALPKEAYALIGAISGAIIALAGSLLTLRGQRKTERVKLSAGRGDMLYKELLSRVQQLASDIGAAAHSMAWLTWVANEGRASKQMLDEYNKEMHSVLPKLVGGQAAVASLDREIAVVTQELREQAYKLDAQIGQAGLNFESDPAGTNAALQQLYPAAVALERAISESLEGIMHAKKEAYLKNL
jgi:hypothetical protein